MKELQDERAYDNDEDGVAEAITNAASGETLLRDGRHHVVYGDYGRLTACKKVGGLEAPEHLFVSFELYDYQISGTDDDTQAVHNAPVFRSMLDVIEDKILPYGDVEPSPTFNSYHKAIFRLEQ